MKGFLYAVFAAVFLSSFALFEVPAKSSSVSQKDNQKKEKKVWVFIMAGQSNMAGRGKVEAEDTITSARILSINQNGDIVPAREPLHFYEPNMAGLDCGLSFGKELLKYVPNDVSILLVPTAVGGSSINQWLGNKTFRGVTLFSNFEEKVEIAKRHGEIKAILWHQGETDANPEGIASRQQNLARLFEQFRKTVGNESLPILTGAIGSFSKQLQLFAQMNEQIKLYTDTAKNTAFIETSDFKDKGDKLHFDSASQREMGKRFAKAYAGKFLNQNKNKK